MLAALCGTRLWTEMRGRPSPGGCQTQVKATAENPRNRPENGTTCLLIADRDCSERWAGYAGPAGDDRDRRHAPEPEPRASRRHCREAAFDDSHRDRDRDEAAARDTHRDRDRDRDRGPDPWPQQHRDGRGSGRGDRRRAEAWNGRDRGEPMRDGGCGRGPRQEDRGSDGPRQDARGEHRGGRGSGHRHEQDRCSPVHAWVSVVGRECLGNKKVDIAHIQSPEPRL